MSKILLDFGNILPPIFQYWYWYCNFSKMLLILKKMILILLLDENQYWYWQYQYIAQSNPDSTEMKQGEQNPFWVWWRVGQNWHPDHRVVVESGHRTLSQNFWKSWIELFNDKNLIRFIWIVNKYALLFISFYFYELLWFLKEFLVSRIISIETQNSDFRAFTI